MVTQAELGQRIRQAREAIGLSQRDFSEAVSKDQTAISEYETGKRKVPAVNFPYSPRYSKYLYRTSTKVSFSPTILTTFF